MFQLVCMWLFFIPFPGHISYLIDVAYLIFIHRDLRVQKMLLPCGLPPEREDD